MKIRNRTISDDYLTLVQRFPLVAFRSQRECDEAFEVIRPLSTKVKLTSGEADYLYAMSELILAYEENHPVPPSAAVSPISSLKFLMQEHQMSSSDLGRLLGDRSLGTNILTGKRELSKTHIRRLADYFKVSPALFI